MEKQYLNDDDIKILRFLKTHHKNHKLYIFCSIFSFLIGVLVVLTCFKIYKERFLWEGLYFISLGFVLIFTNSKFTRIYKLIKKIQQTKEE